MGLFDFFRKKKEKPVEHKARPDEKKSEKPLEQKSALPLRQKESPVEQRTGNQTRTGGHRQMQRTPAKNANKPHTGTKPAASQTRNYTVKAGDSLSRIAKEFYGNANEWQKIYQANLNRIKDPNVIHPGQKIVIP